VSVSQDIANYVVAVEYTDIPAAALKKARACILDSIGVALYGSGLDVARIVQGIAGNSLSPEGGASIIAGHRKVSPASAAFANGVMAHIGDFDDMLVAFRGHPSSVVMPAALAACESGGGTGKDLITAFVVGVELGGKLGGVMGWEHYDTGFHPTGTVGAIAAAAAAAKALALKQDEIVMALGIAASSASGLRVNFGTMTKSYHAGHAAMVGVLAAELARAGFDASPVALDGESGFAKTLGCGGDISIVGESLGRDYAINKILMKPYPSCAGTHPAIDAILKIRKKVNLKAEDVAEIEVLARSSTRTVLIHHNPQTPLEGKFSMEYCVAAALVFGEVGIEQFEETSVFNHAVRAVMGKVKVVFDNELEKLTREGGILSPVRIKLKLRGGKEYFEAIDEAKGGPSYPMSQNEIQTKFKRCAQKALPASRIESVLQTIRSLDSLSDISELTSLLCAPKTGVRKNR
jgi:2-methylcitrate dehydratase PrpD